MASAALPQNFRIYTCAWNVYNFFTMKTKTPPPVTTVTIDAAKPAGRIKPMNAVNNGPSRARSDQSRGNFDTYKALRTPYARIHDANWCSTYGAPHTVDVTAVFPDFDADVSSPASYDFTMTDAYLQTIVDAGTEVFFRLGQSIEHGVKKYGILPPKDNQKWAEICEHIIRHYTEGWAGGFKWKLDYWELWNEPDLHVPLDGGLPPNPKTWTGNCQQFFDLYATAAKHLKKCFPHLKIGGPALAGGWAWAELFLADMKKRKVPIDFFSWHIYAVTPEQIAGRCDLARQTLDKFGYRKTESILNEWNYVKDWSPSWVYSLEVESGTDNLKDAAFIAATMSACQDKPLDMLMYYDARVGCAMNGLFDLISLEPLKGYYPFYAWAKLADLGKQVKAKLDFVQMECYAWKDVEIPDVYVTAAASADGSRHAALISRYQDDNNVNYKREVKVKLAGKKKFDKVACHLTDAWRTYTEVPLDVADDGSVTLMLGPRSFAFIEW